MFYIINNTKTFILANQLFFLTTLKCICKPKKANTLLREVKKWIIIDLTIWTTTETMTAHKKTIVRITTSSEMHRITTSSETIKTATMNKTSEMTRTTTKKRFAKSNRNRGSENYFLFFVHVFYIKTGNAMKDLILPERI